MYVSKLTRKATITILYYQTRNLQPLTIVTILLHEILGIITMLSDRVCGSTITSYYYNKPSGWG